MPKNYSKTKINAGILASIMLLLAIAGCGQHVDKVSDINDNPSKYLSQTVTLAGQVTQVYGVPLGLSSMAAYKLDDDTGTIWVITHDGAPEKGTKLGLTGIVKSISQLIPSGPLDSLGQYFGNVVDEQQRRTQ